MLKPWQNEAIENAVSELLDAGETCGPHFTSLDDLDRIKALTGASVSLVLHVREQALSRDASLLALVTAEGFLSDARMILIAIRFDLLPKDADALLQRIRIATAYLDDANRDVVPVFWHFGATVGHA